MINEFGEIGLDHELVEAVDGDVVLLRSGCICCSIRGDLATAMRALWSRRETGAIAPFRRLLVETTGLADPTPVVATVMTEPVIRHHFRLEGIIATVDAVNGGEQLTRHAEAVKQAAVADRLVLTKADLASADAFAALSQRLQAINPAAQFFSSANAPPPAGELIGGPTRAAALRHWLAVYPRGQAHDGGIRALALELDQPIEWAAFGLWLGLLLASHGDRVLRIKGILDVAGSDTPVVVHGVQRLMHPPVHLKRWPTEERRSRLVLIVADLDPARIRRSLAAFRGLESALLQEVSDGQRASAS